MTELLDSVERESTTPARRIADRDRVLLSGVTNAHGGAEEHLSLRDGDILRCEVLAEGITVSSVVFVNPAEEFRRVVTEVAPTKPGGMENVFGYLVCVVADPSDELVRFATEEYTVADRRTSIFPLIYDLESETLYKHTVPRLKGRGFYEKQKLDAESLFLL